MDQADPLDRFRHRPSVAFHKSIPFRKSVFSPIKPTSDPEATQINDFNQAVIKNRESGIAITDVEDGNGSTPQSERDHLSKALKKEGIGIDKSSLEDILYGELSNNYVKCVYFTCVYTVSNYFGVPGLKSEDPQNVLEYIDQMLHLEPTTKMDYLQKAKKVKAPDYHLVVKIIEAANLVPTDVDGLSDPYCKMWINGDREAMKKTSVKEHTLNPEWNETFTFGLKDLQSDVLRVEIWDEDPWGIRENLMRIKDVKGTKGLAQFCRECCRNVCLCGSFGNDDFVGRVDVHVKDIPSEGTNEWLSLVDEKGKSFDGLLHISAEFSVPSARHMLNALKRHLLLLKVIFLESVEKNKNSQVPIITWEEFLSRSATTLIFQHGKQSGVASYDAVCNLIVFVHLIQDNFHLLYSVTKETHKIAQRLFAMDSATVDSLQSLYREAIRNVHQLCKAVITTLHGIDFVQEKERCVEFEFVLRCADLCEEIASTEEPFWALFKPEAISWLAKLVEDINKIEAGAKSEFLVSTLTYIHSYHSALDKLIRNIFPDKTYTQFTFDVLDLGLSKNIKPHIAKLTGESQNSFGATKKLKLKEAFEIFMRLQELSDYISSVTNSPETDLILANFRDWFGINIMEEWFKWKEESMVPEIQQFINRDDLKNASTECARKRSSSVELTESLINQELLPLQKSVFHSKYRKCDSAFLKVLHSVCMKYSEFLLESIYKQNIFSNFQVIGMKQLCVMANNVWSLATFANNTVSGTQVKVPTNTRGTQLCLELTCRILSRDIAKEFEREIATYFRNICEATSRRNQAAAIQEYANGMQQLISKQARPNMAANIYLLFMEETWKIVIDVVSFFKEAYKGPGKVSIFGRCKGLFVTTPSISEGLFQSLVETEKCFESFPCSECPEKIKDFIWTDEYRAFRLELHQSNIYS